MFSTDGRKGKKGSSSGQELPEVENPPDRGQARHSQRARNIPSDATHIGNGPATARTMKDAQRILRHASIRTTANIYMQPIPASVMSAINSRTQAILGNWEPKLAKVQHTTVPNGSKLAQGVSASA
jgi:hypothetical protein